jgi:YfiH family protein
MQEAWIQPDWPRLNGVHARVTTRFLPGRSAATYASGNLGDRCGDAPDAVAANRASLAGLLDLPGDPCWLRQVHGTAVHRVDAMPAGATPMEADASVTRLRGCVLAVLTADCLPVLFAAADGSEIAIAHAGWRGLAAGVLEATLGSMRTVAAEVSVWLGPGIGAASYEVGDEVRQAFMKGDAGSSEAFRSTRDGHWSCDLYRLARRRLTTAGVRQIEGGDFDTFRDPRFYSHRRQAPCGRFASLIWRS